MDPGTMLQPRAQNPDSVRERGSYSRRPPSPRRPVILVGFTNTTFWVHFFDALTGTVLCHPGSQRVHIVSPMNDLSILDGDDRDEPVVIACATGENSSVHFVLQDHDATILRAMHNECIAGVELDRHAVSRESSH